MTTVERWKAVKVVGLLALSLLIFLTIPIQAQSEGSAATLSSSLVDPNRASSEFNHHVAGYGLIALGLFVIAGLVFSNVRSLRVVWPILFIAIGIYLAGWSDAEIWPRGNLSWTWLLHHDREAMQHKVYALLLIALGLVELLRATGRLHRGWSIAAFPLLALTGAGMLLVHDHNGGPRPPAQEFQPYLINPSLDQDGRSWPSQTMAEATPPPNPSLRGGAMAAEHLTMPMDHSTMAMGGMSHSPGESHHHMTPAMMQIERSHFWFMIVGLGIAVFKLWSDSQLWRKRFVPYLWPSATIVLGVLLTMYHE